MEKDKVANTVSVEIGMMFAEAIMLWGINPKKQFLSCWKKVLEEGDFVSIYSAQGKKLKNLKGQESDILKQCGRQLADYVSVQAFAYAYDFIRNNYSQFNDEDKKKFDTIKDEILQGVADDAGLLRIMRNAFAHNDEDIARVEYDVNTSKFTIHFNKNKDSVILDKIQLFKLLEIYANYINSWQTDKYKVIANPLIAFPFDLGSSDYLLKLVDAKTGKKVPVDQYQKEVLDGVVDRVRNEGYVPNFLLNLYYPYKSNSFNNNAKMSTLAIYIKDLIEFSRCDREMFLKKYRANKRGVLEECTRPTDEAALFISNMLFIMCANNSNNVLQECMADINDKINMTRIRNAVIHGTFFHDKKEGFHFYDGNKKTEEDLGYVGHLSFMDIAKLKDNLFAKKFGSFGENSGLSMGNKDNPIPHVSDPQKQ